MCERYFANTRGVPGIWIDLLWLTRILAALLRVPKKEGSLAMKEGEWPLFMID